MRFHSVTAVGSFAFMNLETCNNFRVWRSRKDMLHVGTFEFASGQEAWILTIVACSLRVHFAKCTWWTGAGVSTVGTGLARLTLTNLYRCTRLLGFALTSTHARIGNVLASTFLIAMNLHVQFPIYPWR